MSNPEFKRNLWLSFSTHRLVSMPALLALTFMAVAMSDFKGEVADNLYATSIALFIFIVWLWGARNANAAIIDELRDKTWDQQRMSALDPWSMTWGKLFGSTSFNWYGGLMCLVIVAVSGFSAYKVDILPTLLSLCVGGVLLHSTLIALNLHLSQFDTRIVQRGGMGWLVIISVFILLPAFSISEKQPIVWWGMEIDHALFWLDSLVLFATCTTFAAWRVMCNALQVRTLPWAWPVFVGILTFYFAGFMPDSEHISPLWLTGLLASIALSYSTLLTESNTLLRWRKLRMLQQKKDWRGWLENLPLWPTTLALSFVFALLLLLTSQEDHLTESPMDHMQPQHALTLALMLLRDACILLFFSLAPNSRRAVGAAMLYLVVLNMLLPFLASVAGLDSVHYFFLPFEAGHEPWSSVLMMTIHTSIAIGLVNWRLRKAETA